MLTAVLFFLSVPSVHVLGAQETGTDQRLSLSLEDAVRLGLENNEQIQRAREGINKAKGAVTEYRADAWPNITGNATYTYNILRPSTEMDIGGAMNEVLISMGLEPIPPVEVDLVAPEEYVFNVGLTQNIYTFGRLHNAIKLAKLYVEIAQTNLFLEEELVELKVRSAYNDALYTRELVRISRAAYDQARRHRENLAAKFERGLISEYEYLRAEVEEVNRRPAVRKSKDAMELAEKNLKRVIGLDLGEKISLTDSFSRRMVKMEQSEAIREAMDSRTELQLLRLKKESSLREYRIYRSNMLPALSAFSNYTYSGSESSGFGGSGDVEWYSFWDVGLQLYVPIFDGFRNMGRMKQAKADMTSAVLDILETEKGIRLEVEQILLEMGSIEEEMEALRRAVDLAKRTVELVSIRYENGLATQVEVNDGETALVVAETNLADALYRYNGAGARLDRALGRRQIAEDSK